MINTFEEYNTLYVFDFDDTLVQSPRFEELSLKYLVENKTVKELLDISLSISGANISDLEYENGRIFIQDPNERFIEYGNWKRKGPRLYLLSPNIFSTIDESLPIKLKETADIYKRVENKCIITARPEKIKNKISNTLDKLGLEFPKYGLHMLPTGRKNAGVWKGEKIVELLKKTGYKRVVFYDDNSRYLSRSGKVVKSKLPDVEWVPVKIK